MYFLIITLSVLKGCQWAIVKAVNFVGTWRKCLCVHSVGSPLLLGLSLLLSKSATHACVAVFIKQVGRQQCSGFMCIITSAKFQPFVFLFTDFAGAVVGQSRLWRVGRYRQALPVLGWWDRHQPRRVVTAQAAPRQCRYSCLHPRLAWVWVCYKIYVIPVQDHFLFSHSWAKLFSLCCSLKWLKSVLDPIAPNMPIVGFQVQHQLVQLQENFAAMGLHCRRKINHQKGRLFQFASLNFLLQFQSCVAGTKEMLGTSS